MPLPFPRPTNSAVLRFQDRRDLLDLGEADHLMKYTGLAFSPGHVWKFSATRVASEALRKPSRAGQFQEGPRGAGNCRCCSRICSTQTDSETTIVLARATKGQSRSISAAGSSRHPRHEAILSSATFPKARVWLLTFLLFHRDG